MKNIIVACCLILISSQIFAGSYSCIGMEGSQVGSKTWKVILDVDGSSIIVNGDKFNMVNFRKIKKGMAIYTQNFTDEAERYVYDAFIKYKGEFYLAQYYVNDDKLISYIHLSCHQLDK